MIENNYWVYDVETFTNCFTLVARQLDSNEYKEFVIHESRDDLNELIEWLKTTPKLIGFNNIEFDDQIVEYIWRSFLQSKRVSANEIYKFLDKLPINTGDRFKIPYDEWKLTFKSVDLFKVNHYDNKKTGLKWLEFSTRWNKLSDLPLRHDASVSKSKLVEVLRYNKNDVNITYDFFYRCKPMIKLRKELAQKFDNFRIMNMSDTAIGTYIFEHVLTKEYGLKKKELKKGTHRDSIVCKDLLVDYISFNSIQFTEIYNTFKNRIYEDVPTNGIKGSMYEQTTLFDDMVFVFGSGGLHACWRAGEFTANDEYVIMSVDVASYYPNLAIKNRIYPNHIGSTFCSIYRELYEERKKYPKGSALNFAYKIALNATYGKSNNEYSIFYDPAYTLAITVNGQLLLAMLCEELSKIGRLIMVNTDGVEVKIKRSDMEHLKHICSEWEAMTGLELEYTTYKKLVVKDVNNYIAVTEDGSPKRKGMFEIYEDITEEGGKPHSYEKTPNATIIPKALFNYYVNDIPLEDVVETENDIYEFLYGIKSRKGFEYWLIRAEENGVIDIEKRSDRVLRYFISPQGQNIYKFWKDDRVNNIQAVNKGQLVTLAMNIRNSEITREVTKGTIKAGDRRVEIVTQFDIDRDFYIRECQKWVDHINQGERDGAYIKYMKQQEKLNKELV